MRVIGNFFWFILVGLWSAIGLCLGGIVLCITIIGIPLGLQCFKIAGFVIFPFGKDVKLNPSKNGLILIANIIWLIIIGIWEFIGIALAGLVLCITIIGIPFGLQCFKLAKLCAMPFGADV